MSVYKLCFNEKVFHEKNFSVDKFLIDHRHLNLETLRDDLGLFLKNLRSSTIELINKDYADFLELSVNLIAAEKVINETEIPVHNLESEVMVTKNSLDATIDKMSNLLNQRRETRMEMQQIMSGIKVQNCIDKFSALMKTISGSEDNDRWKMNKLGRVLSEIHQYFYHSKQCDFSMKDEFEKLFEVFLMHLKTVFLYSIKQHDETLLSESLSLYLAVNKVSLAHEIVKLELVVPLTSNLVNEDSLHNIPGGLEKLYLKILSRIDNELGTLFNLTQDPTKNNHIKGFDFMVNSVWPELQFRLEFNLKSIYSPGDPDLFFKRYNLSLLFLDDFESRCVTRKSVTNLRSGKSYKDLLNCWNLSVYYTLRFQEIGGHIEEVIHSRKSELSPDSNDWKLLVSHECWNCMMRCWDTNTFIKQLAHRFWKLSLQIISRYQMWTLSLLDMIASDCLPISKTNFLMYAYNDGCHLIHKFPSVLETALSRVGGHLSTIIMRNMEECLKESEGNIRSILRKIELAVIDLVAEKNVPVIRQVGDIPRLYRRTNRETPTQPCPYVMSLFTPIDEIENLNSKYVSHWVPSMLSAITRAYHEQVMEVLTAVQRTEESLRKFKQIRDGLKTDSKNNTDDDKIRLQLQIDIQHYLNMVKLRIECPDGISKFGELSDMLHCLKRN